MKRLFAVVGWCVALVAVPALWGGAQFSEADLTVQNVELDPASPKAGQTVTIRAEIVNLGRERVEDRFDATIKIDGVRLATFRVTLSAIQSRVIETSWEATEGQHDLLIEVDEPRDQIQERNERNNTLQLTFSVGADSDVESFTRAAIATQALAWEQASRALTISTGSTNLLLLLDLIKVAFKDFSKAFSIAEAALSALATGWPAAFSSEDAVTPLLAHYATLRNAAGQIEAGLDQLDLNATITAMGDIEGVLRELAALSGPMAPLAGLAPAADTLALALADAQQAQERFGTKGNVDESIAALIGHVNDLGAQLGAVGGALRGVELTATARFLDPQSQELRELVGAFSMTVQVPGLDVRFELVDASGGAVLALAAEGDRLSWQGQGAQGARLPAGTYFFRVRWTTPDGDRAEVGSLQLR